MLSGLSVVPSGPRNVAALREVHRQLAGDLAGSLTVTLLEPLGRTEVEPHPVPDRDPRIEHMLVERMNEGIAAGYRPVGPLGHARRSQELAAMRKRLTSSLDFLHVDSMRRPDRRREFSTRHTDDLEHRLLVRGQDRKS